MKTMPVLPWCLFFLSIGVLRWPAIEASSSKGTTAEGWLENRQRRSASGDVIVSSPLNPSTETGGVDAESLSGLLKESPWALVAFRDYPAGRRHTVSFTPRLGRDSGEDKEEDETLTEEEEEFEAEDEEESRGGYGKRRTPPFAPRLGRRSSPRRGGIPFIPRMGRRQVRGGAGGEEAPSHASGNPDRHYLFSPRLGRSTSPAESLTQPRSSGAVAAEEGGAKEA